MFFKPHFKTKSWILFSICLQSCIAMAMPPTKVDLAELRQDAQVKVAKSLGVAGGSLSLKHIWYVDLATDTNSPLANDQSRIMVIFDIPTAFASDLPGFQVAETYGLNGFEDTILVLDQAPRYAQKAAVYTLDLNQDLTKEIQSLQSQYPSAQFSYLKNIGMLTAGAPDLATFLQVRKSVGALAGISSSSISFESYKMPFSLGKPVDLGQADQSTVIDLEQIRTESKNLKSHGVQFYTQTSLPKPFGYGPFAGYSIQNLLITVTATDPNEVEKIASRLAPYGIKVESVLKSSGIIIGSYINSDETPLESLKKNEKSISSVEFTSNSGSSSKAEQSKRK